MTLLAQELALVAVKPGKGRPALGSRSALNACLAGLLVADLVLDGGAALDCEGGRVSLTGRAPSDPLLAAVAGVVQDKGPKLKAVYSGMDGGLNKQLGRGTWEAVLAGLGDPGGLQDRHDQVVARLQAAAQADTALDERTGLVLAMTGPANLLEVLAPHRGAERRHARARIDHALDGSPHACLPQVARKLIEDANTAAAVAATTVATGG